MCLIEVKQQMECVTRFQLVDGKRWPVGVGIHLFLGDPSVCKHFRYLPCRFHRLLPRPAPAKTNFDSFFAPWINQLKVDVIWLWLLYFHGYYIAPITVPGLFYFTRNSPFFILNIGSNINILIFFIKFVVVSIHIQYEIRVFSMKKIPIAKRNARAIYQLLWSLSVINNE